MQRILSLALSMSVLAAPGFAMTPAEQLERKQFLERWNPDSNVLAQAATAAVLPGYYQAAKGEWLHSALVVGAGIGVGALMLRLSGNNPPPPPTQQPIQQQPLQQQPLIQPKPAPFAFGFHLSATAPAPTPTAGPAPSHPLFSVLFGVLAASLTSALDGAVLYSQNLPVAQRLAANPDLTVQQAMSPDYTPPVAQSPTPPPFASDVDTPPAFSVAPHDDVAVVVGIEKYQGQVPAVQFAKRDAATMRDYLIRSLGFKAENVILLTDEQATRANLDKVFHPKGQAANYLRPESRLWVYFAGHGAPDTESKQAFLVPYDGDPNYAKITGYGLKDLYDNLAKLPAKSVTVMLDACFSGATGRSEDSNMLIAGARPLFIAVDQAIPQGKVTVLAAASGDQISSYYPDQQHGLFTYFLLKGLGGAADINQDKTISVEELHGFVKDKVTAQARRMNREQTPSLTTAPGAGPLVQIP